MRHYILSIFFSLATTSCIYTQNPLSTGENFASINGIKIHYYVTGNGPVCLLPSPGWGPSVELYKKSLQPFEKYFTMVYYNTRMSGKSTGPPDSTKYTSRDFMNDMDSFRVYLKQPKVWVMGHSAGGFQVLYYGIHHNDKLNGIIALNAIAGLDSMYEASFTKEVMKRQGQPYFEKGSRILFGTDTIRHSIAEELQIILPFFFHDTAKIQNLLKLTDPVNDPVSQKASNYTQASRFSTEYLFPELGKIKVPVLVVVGDDDFISDKVSQADRIVKNISSATGVVIRSAGHFPWIEQPTEFFTKLEKWLKEQKIKEQK